MVVAGRVRIGGTQLNKAARRTVVVAGPLASRMRRTRAARDDEMGLEIVTLPALAARLAGGLLRAAGPDDLLPAITDALAEGGLSELGSIAGMPGMPRAVMRTLGDFWRTGAAIPRTAARSPRSADLASLDARVRAALPAGVLVAPDLRDAAMSRGRHAPAVLGPVALEGVVDVDPVWRRLLVGMSDHVPLSWITRGDVERRWFPGTVEVITPATAVVSAADACADPRAEVVEALRWARSLLARGDVAARDVAVVATVTEPYDLDMLVLAREAGLPLHFTHGVAALESRDGQACAALADLLLRGPTQGRIRRLLRRADVDGVPPDWWRGLPRGALLATAEHWRCALAAARPVRASGDSAEEVIPELVALTARGPSAAAEAGERLLRGGARRLWRDALRTAPAAALELSLASLRRRDVAEPDGCVSWGPASHLAAAPRPHVRLLGLTARDWPRTVSEDPLAPEDADWPQGPDAGRRDLLHHAVIVGAATGCLALSRPRRTASGNPSPPSRLWPASDRTVSRGRVPPHAFGEADRLLARPDDARVEPLVAGGLACWQSRRDEGLTAYDGLVQPGHPSIERTLCGTLSLDALKRLLRDPAAFLLLDVLRFRRPEEEAAPLALGARGRGELVHELLRRAIDALGDAQEDSPERQSAAVLAAANAVAVDWPLARSVPPPLPWRHAVDDAVKLAVAGLRRTPIARGTTRWTEVAFGGGASPGRVPPGWDGSPAVVIGGLRASGRIDRLDFAGGGAARVIDWKTGEPPPPGMGLLGGAELQRVIYAEAVRRASPMVDRIRTVIVHLAAEPTKSTLEGEALDACRAALDRGLEIAARRLRDGFAVPGGPARSDPFDPIRLALPADLDGWLNRKSAAIEAAMGPLRALWEEP